VAPFCVIKQLMKMKRTNMFGTNRHWYARYYAYCCICFKDI